MRRAPSTLGHAILGLLARRPSTGYELARRLDRPVGWFWTARHSQIYPELARLTAAGLVRYAESDGRGPRRNKRYRITPPAPARSAPGSWRPHEPQPVRDLETLRLWSLWTVAPAEAMTVVERARAAHAEVLAAFEAELAERARRPGLPRPGASAVREPAHARGRRAHARGGRRVVRLDARGARSAA